MPKRSPQPAKTSLEKSGPRSAWIESDGPRLWVVSLLLAVAIGFVYGPALRAPFIFDDRVGIVDNISIYSLWPLVGPPSHPGPLNPGPDMPSSPRPLVNLSLAINYALGGDNPFGYHVFSVVLHFLTAVLLWAVVRRTLRLPYFGERFDATASWLALAVALLWALHPLVTETVIYATQRSELMMALFYLDTLYCSLRYWLSSPLPVMEGQGEGSVNLDISPTTRRIWLALAILSCLAGMASKEVMVSAPLMILLFERTFIAGSIRSALQRSWPLYVGLLLTWILLWLVVARAPYGTAAGVESGVPLHHWWLTQAKVFLMYLKLALWPWPLMIHYELPYFTTLSEAWAFVLPIALLGLGTLYLLWRNNPVGYLGTLVFAVLAPTSLIPIRLEMAAERRMYFPLAAIVTLLVVGGYVVLRSARFRSIFKLSASWAPHQSPAIVGLVILLALASGVVSGKRRSVYSDEMALWQQVLEYQPNNLFAHNNLGLIHTRAGRTDEAIKVLQATLAIKPDYTYALNNLGNALSAANRLPEAVAALEKAIQLDPKYFQARNNLGLALMHMERLPEAIEQLRLALEQQPDNSSVRVNLGSALTNADRLDEAINEFRIVLAADPDNVLALNNLSIALARTGKVPEAIEQLEHVLRLEPNNSDAHTNLGIYLVSTGKAQQALEHFRRAIQINPNDANAHLHYGKLLTSAGRANEAVGLLEHSLRLSPNIAETHTALGTALQRAGRRQDAIPHFQKALELDQNIPSYANLAQAYRLAKKSKEAIATAEAAIELAEAAGHPETVTQVQEWLKQYRAELERQPKLAEPEPTPATK
jgi:tetratricopeptide (TPR) repeat protein